MILALLLAQAVCPPQKLNAVQFAPGEYRTGDYWLIPARVATGDIEWPRTGSKPDFLPPRGVEHHYAPLGQLTWDGKAWNVTSCLCTLSTAAQLEAQGVKKATPTSPIATPTQPQPQPPPPAPPQPGASK